VLTAEHVLETERLILRHLTMDDLDALAAIYGDPDVRRYFPEGVLVRDEAKEELEWIIDVYYGRYGFGLWATLDKGNGELIGRCGLIPWTILPTPTGELALGGTGEHPVGPEGSEVEVAYLLAKRSWGRGLATEAATAIVEYGFEQLGLERLICLIDPENRASQRVAQKIGMTFERDVDLDGELVPLYSRQRPGTE
jgi:[ribosomal protein S5]-alanine N-acetyltransferase